ncbi:hypothetical protein QBC46DRAFT_415615 [Diplogelasinospora grovesii]|uniref:C3H1-type domain-containing protein n=1 Tax=Diplogelasinospora grovesii TaxID=303347 RepID=A0AAN6NEN0_9PEZI|nr:hypothetical protein QBC46DRAFT_415615 [Diplogelasinospora grovesii]
MDQGHVTEWDPNNFGGEPWEHQFNGSGLGFDPHHDPNNGFHNPNAFLGNVAQINSHPANADTQPSLYPSFQFYPQNSVWSGHEPTTASYNQDASLPQGYFTDQQPSNDVSQTVDSRFAVVNLTEDDDFHNHLQAASHQDAPSHGFGRGVVNPTPPPSKGYIQGGVPQWQGAQAPVSGYPPARKYENPLASAQAANLQRQALNGSPSPYSNGHGPYPGAMQNFQADLRQSAVDTQPAQPQFASVPNGQPLLSRTPVGQHPMRNVGSPQIPQLISQSSTSKPPTPQPPTAQTAPLQPATQQQQSRPQQPTARPQPAQPQTLQFQIVQPQVAPPARTQSPAVQQSALSPAENAVSGVKRRPVSDTQEAKLAAKKAKVVSGPSSVGSPSAQGLQNDSPAPTALFQVESDLLKEARERPDGTWPGVPHLAIGETPVKLKKGPPNKRYVTIATRGDRDPLFPDLPQGWTPAESFGNHANAYQTAQSDLDRQQADARLEIELKRGGNEIPTEWWKKLAKDSSAEVKRLDPPAEPTNTTIRAAELLRIHPSHKANRRVVQRVYEDYHTFLLDKATELKNSDAFDKLLRAEKSRTKTPGSVSDEVTNALRIEIEPLRAQLENAIVEGLKEGDAKVLRRLGEKSNLPIRLLNNLIHLINTNDTNSTLAKAILRLLGRFTSLKRSQLEGWKFASTRAKLEAQGDSEVKELAAAIVANAEKNDDKDSIPPSAASDAKPGAAQTEKVSSADVKPSAKARVPSASVKRPREDDTNGGDTRLAKKAATSSSAPASGGKVSSVVTKSASGGIRAPLAKPTTATSAPITTTAGPAKPRSSMLLPGKSRLAPRPAPKLEPAKYEVQKAPVKSAETAPKLQPVKTEDTKPAAPKPSPQNTAQVTELSKVAKAKAAEPAQSSTSRFAALLAEIAEPKKVKAPTPAPVTPPDLNETPEQKTRRLRKEERRRLNLRVTFRSEDRLCEIREFASFPEERGGRQARDYKSDGKDKAEGMALKKGHIGELRPWEEPKEIDFEVIPKETREKFFATRGGMKTFRTEQQKFMEDREARELMVIYTDPADIPPTPKSPPHIAPTMYDDPPSGVDVHLPETAEHNEIRQRSRDLVEKGVNAAIFYAQARLEQKSSPDYADFTKALKSVNTIANSYHAQPQPQPPSQAPRKDEITFDPNVPPKIRDQQTHQLLLSEAVKNYKDPSPYNPAQPKTMRRRDYPDPAVQAAADYIEDLVERFRQALGTQPQPDPAELQKQQECQQQEAVRLAAAAAAQQQQPAAAAAPGLQDYSAAWAQYYAQMGQNGQQQQQQQAWYTQQQQNAYPQAANPYLQAQPQAPQAAAQQQQPDISALLSALGQNANDAQPQAVAAAATAGADPAQIQALVAALAAGNSNPQGQQAAQAPVDPQYLLSLMNWAQGQNPQAAPAAAYSGQGQGQGQQPSYDQQQQYYAQQQSQSHQDRERDGRGDGYENKNRGKDGDRVDREHKERGEGVRNNNRHKKNKGDVPEHLKGINRALIGTKQCTFWARGQCAKGDKCTFRHD